MRSSWPRGLAGNCALQTLWLGNNGLGTAAVDELLEALAVNVTLTALDMSRLASDDNVQCAVKLVEGCTSLQRLSLNGKKLGPEGAGRLAEPLAGNSSLRTPSLYENGIGDVGTTRLGEVLASNSKLQTLYLSGNGIGNAGAAGLGEALAVRTGLNAYLSLNDNQIGAEGAGRLCAEIAKNGAILSVLLDRNKL